MSTKSFAVELKNFRKDYGLTQKKAAEAFGVSGLTIWLWEKSRSVPYKSTMDTVKEAMTKIIAEHKDTKVPVESKAAPKNKASKKVDPKKIAVKKTRVNKAPKVKTTKAAKINSYIQGLQEDMDKLSQKLDAHIKASVSTTTSTAGSEIVPITDNQPQIDPEVVSILRELILKIKLSRKDGMVRGSSAHVVEWSEICDVYKRAQKVLNITE